MSSELYICPFAHDECAEICKHKVPHELINDTCYDDIRVEDYDEEDDFEDWKSDNSCSSVGRLNRRCVLYDQFIRKYKCPDCGETNTAYEWNEATIEDYFDIDCIEFIFSENADRASFVCPSCNKSNDKDNLTIINENERSFDF